ncbi:MAG: SMP-30/gluconolactonase/LRE family protein [Blastopirellula sp. JB062]
MRGFSLRLALLAALLGWFSVNVAAGQDMPLHDVLIEGEPWRVIAEGYKFTEGPAVDSEGNLFFVDVPTSQIFKYDFAQRKTTRFAAIEGNVSGLMFGPDGRLYGSLYSGRRIVAWDADGAAQTIAAEIGGNDLVVAGDGGIYCTDPQKLQVWYVSPSGEKKIVAQDFAAPNGIILWPDQSTLVVADSRDHHLTAFKVEKNGDLSARLPMYALRLPYGATDCHADGMTVDTAGRLYAATSEGVQMFDPECRISGVIAKPQNRLLANVAFAGPDLKTMVVACGDKIYARRTQATGVRYQPR